jgi:uncharacterized SAM-binding protein YcdF (DUF218 family)
VPRIFRAITAAALLTAVAEAVHLLAQPSRKRASARSEAIIVLGYKSRRNGRTHPVQRWRCQIAVRSASPDRDTTLIMTGFRGEAAQMAACARELGFPADKIVLEERAGNTRENIEFSLPLADGYDVIKIASDPLHARRAWRYIRELRPDLASRLEPAATYRPGEHPLLKAGTLGYELLRPLARHLGPR